MIQSTSLRSLLLVTAWVLIPSEAWAITPGILFPPATTTAPTIVPPGETYQGEITSVVIPKSAACGSGPIKDHDGRVVNTYGTTSAATFALSTYTLACAENPSAAGCSNSAKDLTGTYFEAPYPAHPVGGQPCTLEYGYCNCTGTPGSSTEGPIATDGQVVRTGETSLLLMKFSTYNYVDPGASPPCSALGTNGGRGTIATWISNDCGDTWEFGQYLDGTSPPSSTLPFTAGVDLPTVYVDQFTTPLTYGITGNYHKIYMFSPANGTVFTTPTNGFFWVYEQTGAQYSQLFKIYFPVYTWVRLASPFTSPPGAPVVMTTTQDIYGDTALILSSCNKANSGPVIYWTVTSNLNEYNNWHSNYINAGNCYITTPANLAGNPANQLPNITLARGKAILGGAFYFRIAYPIEVNNSNTENYDEQLLSVADLYVSWTNGLYMNNSSFIQTPNFSSGGFFPPASTWHGGLVQPELFELSPSSALADVAVLYWENSYNPTYGFGTITAEARFSPQWGSWPATGPGSTEYIGTTFIANFPPYGYMGAYSSGDYDRGVGYYDGSTLKFFLPWMQTYGYSYGNNNLTYNILTASP